MENKNLTLVYLVAGISSRFEGKIKQFCQVGPNDETLMEVSMDQALKAGFNKIIFIVGDKTEQPFREKFGNEYKGIPIEYAKQEQPQHRKKPWGTTDALLSAKSIIDTPFIVLNGDDLYGEETFQKLADGLRNQEESNAAGFKLINVLPEKGTTNRGIFKTDEDYNVQEITEVFDISKDNIQEKGLSEESLCSMNIFGLRPQVLDQLEPILNEFKEQYKEDEKKEALLPEDFSSLIKQGKLHMKLHPVDSKWLGVTNPGDENAVREELSKHQ